MPAPPVLYHCPQTRGATTLWMNKELADPCEIALVNIRAGEQDAADYRAVNPMGKIPALVHDGIAVTETAAICAYLADAFPQAGLAPERDDPKRGAYYRWMFFAPSCMEPAMLDALSGVERQNPASVGHGLVGDVVSAAERALDQGPYLLGETFSAADVVFGSTLNFAVMFGAFEKKPAYEQYLARLRERPAFKAAAAQDAQWASEMGGS